MSFPKMSIWISFGLQGQAWHDQAKCLASDPGLFFPEKGGTAYGAAQFAKDICNGKTGPRDRPCPVLQECLEWAIVNNEGFGVWGGLSERERRRLRRERRLNAASPKGQRKRATA